MDFLRKIFRSRPIEKAPEEWIAVHFKLPSGSEFGLSEERTRVHIFSNELEARIKELSVGAFDGDEYGGGEGALFMYGPNADQLFDAVHPLLSTWELLRGGYVIKRYGMPERSERIEF